MNRPREPLNRLASSGLNAIRKRSSMRPSASCDRFSTARPDVVRRASMMRADSAAGLRSM